MAILSVRVSTSLILELRLVLYIPAGGDSKFMAILIIYTNTKKEDRFPGPQRVVRLDQSQVNKITQIELQHLCKAFR